jgi:hypothetical protein
LDHHIREVEVRIAELIQLKSHLAALRDTCPGARPTVACGILEVLGNSSCHRSSARGANQV